MHLVKPALTCVLITLLLGLSACERNGERDDYPAATFEETEAALERGAASYPPAAWVANIDGWLARLEDTEVPYEDEIEGLLRNLRTEVQRSPFDVQRVADLMEELGNWVHGAGEEADDVRAERLGAAIGLEAERLRAEVAGPDGLPTRPARPGAPGAVEQPGPHQRLD